MPPAAEDDGLTAPCLCHRADSRRDLETRDALSHLAIGLERSADHCVIKNVAKDTQPLSAGIGSVDEHTAPTVMGWYIGKPVSAADDFRLAMRRKVGSLRVWSTSRGQMGLETGTICTSTSI